MRQDTSVTEAVLIIDFAYPSDYNFKQSNLFLNKFGEIKNFNLRSKTPFIEINKKGIPMSGWIELKTIYEDKPAYPIVKNRDLFINPLFFERNIAYIIYKGYIRKTNHFMRLKPTLTAFKAILLQLHKVNKAAEAKYFGDFGQQLAKNLEKDIIKIKKNKAKNKNNLEELQKLSMFQKNLEESLENLKVLNRADNFAIMFLGSEYTKKIIEKYPIADKIRKDYVKKYILNEYDLEAMLTGERKRQKKAYKEIEEVFLGK